VKVVEELTTNKIKACKAEAKNREIAKKSKEKLAKTTKQTKIAGPGFSFGNNPCEKGENSFVQKLTKGDRVNVGIIPAGEVNVKIQLDTDKDVDTELWTPDGANAIVAWQCKSHQKKRLKGVKCIDSAGAVTQKFKDITIKYSGWNGMTNKKTKLHQQGKEFIHIIGKSKYAFLIRAYGYEAGTARVKYSWDAKAKLCKKYKKEKSTKAALKKQLEDNANISNEKMSQMLKSVKGCKTSTKTLASMKVKMAAEHKKYKKIQVDYKKCEAKKKQQQAKMKHIRSTSKRL